MNSLILKAFFEGKVKLWKSYWLVGEVFIGLIIISCIHSGLKSDLTADLAFMCIGVGMLFIACLMCVCAAPCCCDYNVYACVKDLYFTD